MSAEGRTTQKTYDRVAESFLEQTRSTELGVAWVERFVCALPPGRPVADLGSGPGRDAALLRARGLRAICVDRSLGMLRAGVDEYPAPRVQGDLLALPIRSASVAGGRPCDVDFQVPQQHELRTIASQPPQTNLRYNAACSPQELYACRNFDSMQTC